MKSECLALKRKDLLGIEDLTVINAGSLAAICRLGQNGFHVAVERYGMSAHKRPESALEGADTVMMLRIQLERPKESLFPLFAGRPAFTACTDFVWLWPPRTPLAGATVI